jgi:hypothetical protein
VFRFADVRYESEHKKGQFEPAEVGKIAEKHFTRSVCTTIVEARRDIPHVHKNL